MIAMLWAQQILAGKKTYAQVPTRLKSRVAVLLGEAGRSDLAHPESSGNKNDVLTGEGDKMESASDSK